MATEDDDAIPEWLLLDSPNSEDEVSRSIEEVVHPELGECPFELSPEEDLMLFLLGGDVAVAEFKGDGGVVDEEQDAGFTPCFLFGRDQADYCLKVQNNRNESSPAKKLVANTEMAEFVAKCTRRMCSVDYRDVPEYSSTAALSRNFCAVAKHAIPQIPQELINFPGLDKRYHELQARLPTIEKEALFSELTELGAPSELLQDLGRGLQQSEIQISVCQYIQSLRDRMEELRKKASLTASAIIVDAWPADAETFQDNKFTKAYLGERWCEMHLERGSGTELLMSDPKTGALWLGEGTGLPTDADVCIVPLKTERCKGKKIVKFEEFLLPVSLKYLGDNVSKGKVYCCMAGFPMVTEVLKMFKNGDTVEQDKFCKKYRHKLSKQVHRSLEKAYGRFPKDPDEITKAFFKEEALKELRSTVRRLMESCFGNFRTGDMICSVGKIFKMNRTALAATYSSLPGASGGAVFSPQLPRGTFVGFHSGSASPVQKNDSLIYPNHNIATSCDNPAFVLSYARLVLPTLPLNELECETTGRVEAFCHWLLLHLKTIASEAGNWPEADLSKWLPWLVSRAPPGPLARRLFQDDVPSEVEEALAGMFMKLSSELLQAARHAKLESPFTVKALETTLHDRHLRRLFFLQIETEVKMNGLNMRPWGLPVKIRNMQMLDFLAALLCEEEEW